LQVVPVLEVEHLSKTFVGRRVLDDAGLRVESGEIHALVGQNGCGKSTLIKCLSGYYEPDPGATIKVAGAELKPPFLPDYPLKLGMRFVHQDLGIVPNLSVAENLGLGYGFAHGRLGRLKWREERARARELLERAGCDVSPTAAAGDLPRALQTMVAIARAMRGAAGDAKVVILDEPSASLPQEDVEILHDAIRRVAASGAGVLLVSHRLGEIFQLASNATVLRDGRIVGTEPVAELDHDSLTDLIVGRNVAQVAGRRGAPRLGAAAPALKVSGLSGGIVRDLELHVDRGEIVGLAGLRGSGRSTVARLVAGAQQRTGGTIEVNGTQAEIRDVSDAIVAGIVYVTEDRQRFGAFRHLSVRENLLLPRLDAFARMTGLRRYRMRVVAQQLIAKYGIRPPFPEAPMRTLSGGNQQKVVLARWLSLDPVVAILDEPVQGVDVGAKQDLFEIVTAAAADGVAALVIDSDFENLCALCHRILVVHDGMITDEFVGERVKDPDEITRSVLIAQAPTEEAA
jgi:ABC-type sugar transport system ATPase subunit